MTGGPTGLERRIRAAERDLFAAVGVEPVESYVDLERTGLRIRVFGHGAGPAVLLLHGVTESAAVWAPLLPSLAGFRTLAVDLPGHGLSDPATFRRGAVREFAGRLIADVLDALDLDGAPVVSHSLGSMFALWHVVDGPARLSQVIAIGQPGVALPGVRVTMPLSLLTVRGVGRAVLRSPSSRGAYRALLRRGLGAAEVATMPPALVEVLRLSARRPGNARSMASLMHAIDRFRRPRAESVLSDSELAGISVPTTFVLGPEDPYLSVEDARPSIDRIPGAQLHVMPGGHAPWLADPDHAARLITSRLTAEWVPPEGA